MNLAELHFDLPPERIAQHPPADRLDARLMVVDRRTGRVEDRTFRDLRAVLRAPDLLVVNDTRVLPAKFEVRRPTGGRIGGLFLSECRAGEWEVLLRGAAKVQPGEPLRFDGGDGDAVMTIVESLGRGRFRVRVEPPQPAERILDRVGQTPLPPYIRRAPADLAEQDPIDRRRYQTVYANRAGAVAAPTAGLHFTPAFLDELAADGIERATVTLDVGIGTFSPVTDEQLEQHRLHAERYDVSADTVARIDRARAAGGRIVAVGTTSTRALEGRAREGCAREGRALEGRDATEGRLTPGSGQTDLFIAPGHRFAVVDALITNFHLPGSTLLALIFAFASRDLILAAYQHAIDREYRFYSYGDAMLIL